MLFTLCLLFLLLTGCAAGTPGQGAGDAAPVTSVVSAAGTGAHGGTAMSSRDVSGERTTSRTSSYAQSTSAKTKDDAMQEASAGTAVSDTMPSPQDKTGEQQEATEAPPQEGAALPTAQETVPAAPEAPIPVQGNGRMLFVGDSRTIDMFADSDEPVYGRVEGDIVIYAMHARGCDYLISTVDAYGHDNFDTLVTWMGANDRGNFSSYEIFYNNLLAEGKKIIVCTVGPTADGWLVEADVPNYTNDKMMTFNASLTAWAYAHGVQVIDLYSYIAGNIQIDAVDGIHYLPRPTTAIWQVIRGSL